MDTIWLVARVVVSLGVVLALIWALARVKKRVSPKGASALQVLSKTPVSKRGSLLLVQIGGRTLLLGSSDTNISLLTEVDLGEDSDGPRQERIPVDMDALIDEWRTDAMAEVPALASRADADQPEQVTDLASDGGPLAGSVLSPQTWRQLTQVLREKTVRA